MRLTASRLHLADRCPASCALPTAADWADSDAAAAGTGRHAYLSALAPELARPPVDARIDLLVDLVAFFAHGIRASMRRPVATPYVKTPLPRFCSRYSKPATPEFSLGYEG